MRFFRKKDKQKNGSGDGRHGWRLPGFGSSSNKYAGPDSRGYRLGGSRPDGYDSGDVPYGDYFQPRPTHASAALLARFPASVLERIFGFVCPHTRDETYSTCEQSSVDDACMLCDLRDLAHCVAVCKKWKEEAVKLLYVFSSFSLLCSTGI